MMLSVAERTAILNKEIARYTKKGFRIIDQTPTSAQLAKPRTFSCLFATLWFLLFGVGLLIYLFWYLAKKDTIVFITVDEQGRVRRR
jgi:uncharacterized membrane protein